MPIPRPAPLDRRTLVVAVLLSLLIHAGLLGLLFLVPADEQRGQMEVSGITLDETSLELAPDSFGKIDADDVRLVYPVSSNVPLPSTDIVPHDSPTAVEPRPPEHASTACTTAPGAAATNHDGTPASGALSGPGGGEGARFFASAGAGHSVVFVLDHSLSMGMNGALNAARRAVLDAVAHLPSDVRFQIVVYNRRADVLLTSQPSELSVKSEATLDEAARALADVEPSGITDHVQALRRGLSLRPDVLYLVTDAEQLSAAEVDLIGRLNGQLTRGQTAIHTVELRAGPARTDAPLRRVAVLNHGTYRRLAPTP